MAYAKLRQETRGGRDIQDAKRIRESASRETGGGDMNRCDQSGAWHLSTGDRSRGRMYLNKWVILVNI